MRKGLEHQAKAIQQHYTTVGAMGGLGADLLHNPLCVLKSTSRAE